MHMNMCECYVSCLVVRLGLRLGLDLISCWLVVMHTYRYYFALSLSLSQLYSHARKFKHYNHSLDNLISLTGTLTHLNVIQSLSEDNAKMVNVSL